MMRKPWKNHHFEAIGLVIDTSLETCWTCNVNAGLSGLDVRNLRISWPNNLGIKFCRGEWEKLRLQETKNQKKTDLTLPRYRAQETFWIIMNHHGSPYPSLCPHVPFVSFSVVNPPIMSCFHHLVLNTLKPHVCQWTLISELLNWWVFHCVKHSCPYFSLAIGYIP